MPPLLMFYMKPLLGFIDNPYNGSNCSGGACAAITFYIYMNEQVIST